MTIEIPMSLHERLTEYAEWSGRPIGEVTATLFEYSLADFALNGPNSGFQWHRAEDKALLHQLWEEAARDGITPRHLVVELIRQGLKARPEARTRV